MRRIASLILVFIFAICCLTGCYEDESDKLAQVQGTWLSEEMLDKESRIDILQNMLPHDEAVALCGDIPLSFIYAMEFKMDKTYQMYCDVGRTKAQIEEYCEEIMETLYRERLSLVSIYGNRVENMSDNEFYNAYASMYDLKSKEEWIDMVVETWFDYDAMGEPYEQGTFNMGIGKIYFYTDKGDVGGSSTYEIDSDGNLSLQFLDGIHTFSRPN